MKNHTGETTGTGVQLLGFGKVIPALKQGMMISRASWQEGEFIFMQVPSRVPHAVIPKMSSLPEAVKQEFINREKKTTSESGDAPHNHSTIDYSNQIAKVHQDNTIFGYTASPQDILAEDWFIKTAEY